MEEDVIQKIIGDKVLDGSHSHNVVLLEHFVYKITHTTSNHDVIEKAINHLVTPSMGESTLKVLKKLRPNSFKGFVVDAFKIKEVNENRLWLTLLQS